ncbi:hypothetical protein P9X10_02910 [Bacillus cereus]|nr:hypothetical protein [Bacillus cereus]
MEGLIGVLAIGLVILFAWKILKNLVVRLVVIVVAIGLLIASYNYITSKKPLASPLTIEKAQHLAQTSDKVRVVEVDGKHLAQVYLNNTWYYINDLNIKKKYQEDSYMVETDGKTFKIEDNELKSIIETLK